MKSELSVRQIVQRKHMPRHQNFAFSAANGSMPSISTTPRLNRSSMLARPWRKINPFGFFWPKRRVIRAIDEEQRGRQSERMGYRYRWQRDAGIRRLILLILTLVQTAVAGVLMADVLQEYGNSFLRYLVLSLFLILFFWVSAGFWTAIA